MLRISRITLAIAALVLLTAAAWAQPEEDYNYISQQPNGNKLDLKVWVDKGDKATYEPGEDIRVYFRTNRDAYVVVYNIDTRGNVHLLYPYEYRDSRFVEGNRPYRIPGLRDDYSLKVNGPQGTERIVAIATREPFYIPDLGWNNNPDQLTEEDYYYLNKPEGEDDWDFIERLNHRIVPDYVDYELDVATFQVEPRYPKSYYTNPSSYFSYSSYPYWYSPDVYFGAVYFDYPFRAAIYIDGIFFGYTPFSLPYFLYGRHYVSIYNQGYLVYRDYCYVRPHYQNRFYVPRDRIYKNYTSRYTKDYRVIKEKPDIFWTKVRELNTKYKATPVIKDDFTIGKVYKDKYQAQEKSKGQVVTEPKISKEKQFKERLKATTGDQLIKVEGKQDKSKGQAVSEPKASKEKQFQERLKATTGDQLIKVKDQQDKSKGQSISEPKISKEKQFKERFQATTGDQLNKIEGQKQKSYSSEKADTPEKRLRQEKEAVKIDDNLGKFTQNESKEQTFRKEIETRESQESRSYKEVQQDQPNYKTDKVEKAEKPKSVEKVRDNPTQGSGKEPSFKSPPRSAPDNSGKVERNAPKGKR